MRSAGGTVQLRRPMDDASAPLFTVGQVAGMLDVQPSLLRRLDEQGVVHPARSAGNQRRYSREQIEQVDEVRALIEDGLTLPGIRQVLRLQGRIAELEARLAALENRTPPPPDSRPDL